MLCLSLPESEKGEGRKEAARFQVNTNLLTALLMTPFPGCLSAACVLSQRPRNCRLVLSSFRHVLSRLTVD